MNENIDFVVPWVDGNDDKWIEERKKNKEGFDGGDDNECRFRDWGLLKYWFRSIERNAPWMRKVHFITYGHLPSFLNPNCPKLHIVKHKDYIPHQYLPTFSANPIELNMHRIEDLSECFVYFNDDMFILDHTTPEFFFKNGKPCDSAVMNVHCYNMEDMFAEHAKKVKQTLVIGYIIMIKEREKGWLICF